MTEWRHRPALDQSHIVAPFGPAGEPLPGKLRPPSEPAYDRLQQSLDHAPQAGLGTDTTDQDRSRRPA